MPLIRLLARLGRQRGPRTWTVSCRDLDGRRARLLIGLSPSGITIATGVAGPLRLDALQVGQLRAAARDAIHTFGLLADPEQTESPRRAWRSKVPTAPLDCPPARRELIYFSPISRPTARKLRDRIHPPSA